MTEVDVEALLADSDLQMGTRCYTCAWLASRPEAERAKWVEALDQPKTWYGSRIARAMAKVPATEDDPPSPTPGSILNHRSGHVKGGNK
jgi:hypothetical protein